MATKSEKEKQAIYTQPELREKLKEQIKAGDKGGKHGQWSARKSQLLVTEYEKAGGGYKNDEPTQSQKDLMEWTEQDWQTADGKIAIRGKKTERYLPKDAWEKLSKGEQKEANTTKEKGSQKGEQFIENTDAVKRVMKEIKEAKKKATAKKAAAKTAAKPSGTKKSDASKKTLTKKADSKKADSKKSSSKKTSKK